jgi:hypothetical protein
MLKKILLFIYIIITNSSCYEMKVRRTLELNNNPTIVIDTSITTIDTNNSFFFIKTYNGKDIEWFQVSENDYNKIAKKDTLKNFTIK